jgi:hypothetical protein
VTELLPATSKVASAANALEVEQLEATAFDQIGARLAAAD